MNFVKGKLYSHTVNKYFILKFVEEKNSEYYFKVMWVEDEYKRKEFVGKTYVWTYKIDAIESIDSADDNMRKTLIMFTTGT